MPKIELVLRRVEGAVDGAMKGDESPFEEGDSPIPRGGKLRMIFILKLICDLSFYFAFANFIAYLYGGSLQITVLLVPVLAATLCFQMRDKGAGGLLPLLLMAGIWLGIPGNFANFVVVMPSIAYCCFLVAHLDEYNGRYDYSDIFGYFAKTYLPFAIIASLFWGELIAISSLPFALTFVAASIVLLRMTRHNSEVGFSRGFMIQNASTVIFAVFLGYLLGSEKMFMLYKEVVRGAYFQVIAPILIMVITVLIYLLRPLFSLLETIFLGNTVSQEEAYIMPGQVEEWEFMEEVELVRLGNDFVRALLYIALFALIAFMIYKLFVKLYHRQMGADTTHGITQRRSAIGGEGRRVTPRRANSPVRHIYQRYISLCRSLGFELQKNTTSENLEVFTAEKLQDKVAATRLREIYLPVRYGEAQAGREVVREARAAFDEIRRGSTGVKKRG